MSVLMCNGRFGAALTIGRTYKIHADAFEQMAVSFLFVGKGRLS
jgi:hypothetical protein